MRCAIHARYSSEKQEDRSIEDQYLAYERHAAHEGWTVAARYGDRALSGASVSGRAELARMMSEAKTGAFDLVLCENLDRLSRDMEGIAAIFKRLKSADIPIVSLAEGRVNETHVSMRGASGATS